MIFPVQLYQCEKPKQNPSAWGLMQEVKRKAVLIREARKVDLMAEVTLLNNIQIKKKNYVLLQSVSFPVEEEPFLFLGKSYSLPHYLWEIDLNRCFGFILNLQIILHNSLVPIYYNYHNNSNLCFLHTEKNELTRSRLLNQQLAY